MGSNGLSDLRIPEAQWVGWERSNGNWESWETTASITSPATSAELDEPSVLCSLSHNLWNMWTADLGGGSSARE
jgi:hypothetical protein